MLSSLTSMEKANSPTSIRACNGHGQVLADYVSCMELEVPEHSQDGINKVKVVFLDAALSRVDGPYQKLGDAQVTTGFFSMHETFALLVVRGSRAAG